MSGKTAKRVTRKSTKQSPTVDDEVTKELKEQEELEKETKKIVSVEAFETNEDDEHEENDGKKDEPKVMTATDVVAAVTADFPTLPTTPVLPVPEEKKKSIIDFDQDEIKNLDTGIIKTTDNMTMLKILIVRGKNEHNPALWAGAQRLLRQLNCEDDRSNRNDDDNERRNRFRGDRRKVNFHDGQHRNNIPPFSDDFDSHQQQSFNRQGMGQGRGFNRTFASGRRDDNRPTFGGRGNFMPSKSFEERTFTPSKSFEERTFGRRDERSQSNGTGRNSFIPTKYDDQ